MAWRLAESLRILRDQINAAYPDRRKSDDGTIGDEHHAAAASDHNPNPAGVVRAMDITHDPAHGVDTYALADYMRAHPDPRARYIISNRRIAGSPAYVKENGGTPWTWARYTLKNAHDHHVHISVEKESVLYDGVGPWDIGPVMPAVAGVAVPAEFPLLKRGATGAMVERLQGLLGVPVDSQFGPATERAVREAQVRGGLVADGIVGGYTWRVLLASTPPAQPSVPSVPEATPPSALLAAAMTEKVVALAASSQLADHIWPERGRAPIGYIKGMSATFAAVYSKLKAGDSAALVMAAAARDDSARTDALTWYDSGFRLIGLNNAITGPDTLRHLFVLLIGLGMRESSGRYCEGRDMSARNTTANTAEAGLFQMSWDAHVASPEIPKLMAAYVANPEGFLSIFREGVTQRPRDLDSFGSGDGLTFQQLCKSCPAFAVEAAAVGLRKIRTHWGPINRHEVELAPVADSLLLQVQDLVDNAGTV